MKYFDLLLAPIHGFEKEWRQFRTSQLAERINRNFFQFSPVT